MQSMHRDTKEIVLDQASGPCTSAREAGQARGTQWSLGLSPRPTLAPPKAVRCSPPFLLLG